MSHLLPLPYYIAFLFPHRHHLSLIFVFSVAFCPACSFTLFIFFHCLLSCCYNITFSQNNLNMCQLNAVTNSSVWHTAFKGVRISLRVWHFLWLLITACFLSPYSIFRMFSADRKRVETALESCNLPSGRVRLQNTEALCFFSSITVASYFLRPWTGFCLHLILSLLCTVAFIFPSIHPFLFWLFSSSLKTQTDCGCAYLSYFLDICMSSSTEWI